MSIIFERMIFMGLETYIIKTEIDEVKSKIDEILRIRETIFSKALCVDGAYLLMNDEMDYMDKIHTDACWVKCNHITAWIAEKVFKSPKHKIDAHIGLLTTKDLIALRNDCQKIINHCVVGGNEIKVDKKFCKKVFPYLDMAFSGDPEYNETFVEEIKSVIPDLDRLIMSAFYKDQLYILYADF